MIIDCDLKRLYYLNHSTHEPWHWIFMVLYAVFTISSVACNVLLLLSLYCHNKNTRLRENNLPCQNNILIRTPKPCELTRDLLISYLAIVGLLLSLTIPLSAIDGLSKFWPLGSNTELLCRVTKSAPSVVVYSSSMIIILIAINCFRQIIWPYKRQLTPANLKYITIGIIIISILISTPQFYYTKLYPIFDTSTSETEKALTTSVPSSEVSSTVSFTLSPINLSHPQSDNPSNLRVNGEDVEKDVDECKNFDEHGWSHVVFCVEDWPVTNEHLDLMGRFYFSLFSFITQLLMPFIIISICHFSIYRRLQKQTIIRKRILFNNSNEEKLQRDNNRYKRRNKLLLVISLVHLVSWLPLSVVSIMLDASPDIFGTNHANISMLFMSCHLIGMSSASVNPVIYGYTNTHVRKGNFQKLYVSYPINFQLTI